MRNTYGTILGQIDDILTKQAFIPAPQSQAGQSMMQGQDQSQGGKPQGGGGDDSGGGGQQGNDYASGGIEGSESFDQGMPQPGADPSGVQGGQDPTAQDPTQQDPKQQNGDKGADGRGDAPPTDLDSTTVTLRLRDVLDLISGGKATQSALKIQDLLNKQQMKNEQMARQQQMKEQQQQQQQQQQQAAMAQGGGMMDSGGIYGNAQTQAPQQGGMGGM